VWRPWAADEAVASPVLFSAISGGGRSLLRIPATIAPRVAFDGQIGVVSSCARAPPVGMHARA